MTRGTDASQRRPIATNSPTQHLWLHDCTWVWVRRVLGTPLLVLLLPLLRPALVGAQDAAPLMSHTYTYAETATFRLSFVGQSASDQATLLLKINGISTDGQTVPVQDGSASVTRDLSTAAFPPFAEITYWWAFETPTGRWVETDRQDFRYVDDRYTWKSVAIDGIRVYWIDGEPSTMAYALDIAEDTQQAISAALQVPAEDEIDIYIYPSETDLASALQLGGKTWVSGITYPQLGVILTAIPPNSGALAAMQRDIPHELTHKALYDLLGAQGYASLPTWLDEGLATFFEASPDPSDAQAIENAFEEESLIPLPELCAPFPQEPARARLAYAQSGSLLQYIRRQYGWSRIRELLAAYADGQACSTGAQAVLGIDLQELDRDWRAWMLKGDDLATSRPSSAPPSLLVEEIGPWLVVLGALLIGPLLVVTIGRRH